MADNLSSAAEALRRSSERLNAITDEAGNTIKAVEDFLNQQCSLGVYASVLVRTIRDDDSDVSQCLSYGRQTGGFRILVEWHQDGVPDPDYSTVKPWSDCTRDDKLATFTKLPALLAELVKVADQRVEKAQETMDSVSQALAAFPMNASAFGKKGK